MRFLSGLLSPKKPGKKPAGKGSAKGAGRAKSANRKGRGKRARSPLLSRRALLWGGGASLAMAVAGTVSWAIASGWAERQLQAATDAAYHATARWGLALDEVLVAGRDETERDLLLAALQVERGMPLLTFDPWAAQARVEALPWVWRAEVERRLPDTIFVWVRERRPLAVWQLQGRSVVIDHSGAPIPGAEPRRFADLPLVVGEDAPRHTERLLTILGSQPELNRQVTAAVRVGGRRWNVQLDGGIFVQLPESAPAEAWAQLADIERQHSVLQRNVTTIDLRLPDRLIIRTQPGVGVGGEETVHAGGKDT